MLVNMNKCWITVLKDFMEIFIINIANLAKLGSGPELSPTIMVGDKTTTNTR